MRHVLSISAVIALLPAIYPACWTLRGRRALGLSNMSDRTLLSLSLSLSLSLQCSEPPEYDRRKLLGYAFLFFFFPLRLIILHRKAPSSVQLPIAERAKAHTRTYMYK